MALAEKDLFHVIEVALDPREYGDLRGLFRCVKVARHVRLKYPVQRAQQLENFLREMHLDVAWFEKRFAEFLPIKDEDDFIVKAWLAVQQVHTLENSGDKWG